MNDESPYEPIACEMYSQLELHIMHGDCLRMTWRGNANIDHMDTIKPLDLKAVRESGEFLHACDSSDSPIKIRLDRILHFEKC
ncbi:MAG: transcriptional antiterminator, Rof [Gammaproteobacteria bacterium]|nr:transcriptional antiterminator, Rof [Gammaproteobacteria bacterium]